MANAVDGEITVTLPINARSEAAFNTAVKNMSAAVTTAVTNEAKKFAIGTSLGDAAIVTGRTSQMFEKKEPVEAKPTKAKKGGRKAGKRAGKKVAAKGSRKTAARKAPAKRGTKKGGRRTTRK